MVKIEILESLYEEIEDTFKQDSLDIFNLIDSLKDSPKKGKPFGSVGGILIKELKYKNYRFYFLTDGYKLKFMREEDLLDLLFRFVRMSNKKYQQETINEIKHILKTLGPEGFK